MTEPASLVGTVEAAADEIYRELTGDVEPSLRSRVDDWCDLHGLDRLDDPDRVVARHAAFNVLLKATLYEQYSQRDLVAALGDDARQALRDAEAATGDPAFGEYVLDDVAWLADDALDDVLAARTRLAATDDPAEEIGRLFESLTPQAARRKLGQFRTPTPIAELMAAWVVQDGTETVLDPGMGAGALAAAAHREKERRYHDAEDTQPQAPRAAPRLSDVHGVDLNELALVMGATTLTLLDHGGPHNLRSGDFLELGPEDLGDLDDPVGAVISNPPYSRHHELPEGYKARVNAQAERELGRDVSALSPMYAYFYYHAAEFLGPGGRLSVITPSEFLETRYGESLKGFLRDEFRIAALVLFDRGDDSKFDEAMTTSLVSFLEKADTGDQNQETRIVRVDDDPGADALLEAVSGGVEGETEWGYVGVVRQADLDPADKWTGLFDPVDIDTSALTPLRELGTVTRGIATGKNSYFCLTQSAVDEWGIDEQYRSKVIRNSRSVPGYDYTDADWRDDRDAGREVWLLYHLTDLAPDAVSRALPTDRGTDQSSGVVAYLQHGRSDAVEAHDGYLARNRNPWFVVDRRDPPPIVLTYMSRGGTRFIRNETSARYLSNLHGLYLDVDLDEPQLQALLAYLNSAFASEVVRRSGRTYSSGMAKIEPNEMEGVPVLDPRDLDDDTVTRLADLFDALRTAARSEDSPRPEDVIADIDALLEEVLDTG